MSTRSRIGILNDDGTVTSVYCHNDGYIAGVGRLLSRHYVSEVRVRKLISLGDISTLGAEPVDNPDLWTISCSDSWIDGYNRGYAAAMSCRTYKGRGETGVDAMVSSDLDDYLHIDNLSIEYSYLFMKGEWYVATYGINKPELQLLSSLVKED